MKRTKYLNWFIYLMLLLSIFSLSAEVSAQKKKDLEKARKIAKLGDQLLTKKDYQGAIAKYSEALAIAPNFAGAHFWKAYAHYNLKEYDQSLSEFNQAESNGFDKPLEIYKIRWYLNFLAKDFDAAATDALAVLKVEPNNALYNQAVGDVYRTKGSYREALPYYQKAAELDPNNSEAPYFLTIINFNLRDTQNQGMSALEALKRKTKYVGESYLYLADALYKQKKFDEAAEYFQKTIDVKPDIDNPYIPYGVLSDIYRSRNEFDKAIAVTRKGLQQFPKDVTLYTSLAWYYSLADRPQDAIIAAKSAINLAPDQYMAYTNLCRAYNDAKEYQMAITTCNSALRINPGDGESYYYMGRAYEFLKQTDKAADAYKKAVDGLTKFTQSNPDYSDGYYLLAGAYFSIGDDDKAIAAYNKCLQLAPRFAKARYALGLTYLIGKRDKSKAREQYNALRQIDENLAEKLRQAIESAK
jgi:tetratricopeptide (TPR) repeat protein